ncbi:MAG: 50S ribosomal protein L3 [Anaerolineae bacterium]|nr:50S ribosomal protein L3 [Anaerolineae bacterium]
MATRIGLLGRKVGMTRYFSEDGTVAPVTVIEAGPCLVTQVKSPERDGYAAIQIGFEESKRLNKPELGHLKGLPPMRHLREVRTDDATSYQPGQRLDVSMFKAGDLVDVVGVSKGRGFAGVMKRHGFGGGPRTHGQSDRQRHPGAISSGTTPGHIIKGLRMAGRMGGDRVTVHNLRVEKVDPERNLLVLRGGIPGAMGSLLFIRKGLKTREARKRR